MSFIQRRIDMATDDRTAGNGQARVVEWAPFRLAPGVEESVLLEASEVLQREFLAHQPGFLRRELLRGDDGQWADLVYWEDEAAAGNAMREATASPACQSYFQRMTGADVLLTHRIRVYE
jgi:heme-degrading monooxygenase HmoA